MTVLDAIATETAKLGYRSDAVRRDYRYSDVWSSSASTRSVPFAAFTQTPPSYRSAAFAVIEGSGPDPVAGVSEHRALGAPLFFVIEADRVSTWQVYAKGTPRLLGRSTFDRLPAYFFEHRNEWAPDVIHRAKSIGRVDTSYQRDFVDVGLIPAIEGETHLKLDRLIRDAIANAPAVGKRLDVRLLFRGIFRLLAAKILMDRGHPRAAEWNADDVASVLSSIGNYYRLGEGSRAWAGTAIKSLAPVWATFKSGFNVANVSADDLAFVYESTLVTDKAREEFGTHSTPRHVADYVLNRLRLWEFGSNPPSVYEPFTGAGVFLGSALRHMRDGLPHSWSDKERHDLLVTRVAGAEIDPFACEVAKLSLILADYPNYNGWRIEEADLFKKDALKLRLDKSRVVLCNPPFQAFTSDEREAYPEASKIDGSKAVFALDTALRAQPDMLGFVVPNTLLVDRRYRAQRNLVEWMYREVELVALPDGVFKVSQADTALLIARDRRKPDDPRLIRSSEVFDREKASFAVTAQVSRTREEVRPPDTPSRGELWIRPLARVWKGLANRPKLGEWFEGHWGLRWKGGQKGRAHDRPAPGRRLGFMDSSALHQYVLDGPRWLDAAPEQILAGADYPWGEPKILCNAARLSRGYWRLAAAVDRDGRLASQQFIGFWPREGRGPHDLDAIAALLNGPVVNAFITERSFNKRFRIRALEEAPMPPEIPRELGKLSRAYAEATRLADPRDPELQRLLQRIDEIGLEAYQLPEDHARAILGEMGESSRPLTGSGSRRRRPGKHALKSGSEDDGIGPLFSARRTTELDVGDGLGEEVSSVEAEGLLRSIASPLALEDWAGEVISGDELASRLPMDDAELSIWQRSKRLVALEDARGRRVFPTEQLVDGKPLTGLEDVVRLVGDERAAWLWLRQPNGVLDRNRPLDILKAGGLQEVLQAASRDFN